MLSLDEQLIYFMITFSYRWGFLLQLRSLGGKYSFEHKKVAIALCFLNFHSAFCNFI
jgi:hypothetical protein